jgi:hypothetical protein
MVPAAIEYAGWQGSNGIVGNGRMHRFKFLFNIHSFFLSVKIGGYFFTSRPV